MPPEAPKRSKKVLKVPSRQKKPNQPNLIASLIIRSASPCLRSSPLQALFLRTSLVRTFLATTFSVTVNLFGLAYKENYKSKFE